MTISESLRINDGEDIISLLTKAAADPDMVRPLFRENTGKQVKTQAAKPSTVVKPWRKSNRLG